MRISLTGKENVYEQIVNEYKKFIELGIIKKDEKMCETYLDKFKQEMEPAKKIYTEEIKKLAENYDFLGEMKIREEPDIDTQDYVYVFKNLNGTSEEVLDKTLNEMYLHMKHLKCKWD